MGDAGGGIDMRAAAGVAAEIREALALGAQLAVVIGGGNLVRGARLARDGMDRAVGDHMGMLATIINALALQEALEQGGMTARVMSAVHVNQICEAYIRRRAVRHLERGRVVVFAAGLGNPFFTTDTAASLRAAEIGVDMLLKATKVDGVYAKDPVSDPGAERYRSVGYDEVLSAGLGIMDATAIVMCRDHGIPVRVFNVFEKGALGRIVRGEALGTLIAAGGGEARAAHADA